eukprot:TRINITY_DN7193_c0_g1_i1.p1 TRINITY_DN7193_c0_g1~~TRINITY_DN7193_c0_g1_i1.p1  ORF type:complete len:136 (-),score=35.13 TRINITY_DN7193_c0_g1_i1:61-468(-)
MIKEKEQEQEQVQEPEKEQEQEPSINTIINNKWKLEEQIGKGGFGYIYRGHYISDPSRKVAIKFERKGKKYLEKEEKFYKNLQGGDGIPKLLWFGRSDSFTVAVMELKGPSLSELFHKSKKRFSLKTVLMLAEQM